MISFDLFKEGKLISEIAKERNLTISTVEGHLAYYVETGVINIDDLVNTATQAQVNKVMNENSGAAVQRLKDLLPKISYGEIRMMMAAEKFAAQ